MVFLVTVATALLAAGGAIAAPADIGARSSSGLNARAKAAGKLYFGSATDSQLYTDSDYAAKLANTDDFGQITPGNALKWQFTEPSQDSFVYTDGDKQMDFAKKNGQLRRCHNLVWHWQIPGWVTTTTWTRETLIAAMTKHITDEVTHFKGQCYAWDVVNEPLNEDGTWRQTVFYNVIGPDYMAIAFKAAAAADPDAKLYFNDFNIEAPGAKATGALSMVKSIQAAGAPIHGVGFESHFIAGMTPSRKDQASNMAAFTALGVDVAVTELDVRILLPSTPATFAQQASDYNATVGACLDTPRCVGITVWDWSDKYSWISSFFTGYGDALPFDKNLQPKPAYFAMMSLLQDAAISKSSGGSTTSSTSSSTTKSPASSTTLSTSSSTAKSPASATTLSTRTSTAQPSASSSTQSASNPTNSACPATKAQAAQAHWAQCGGANWSGSTTCVAPYTCRVSNAYYSQCL